MDIQWNDRRTRQLVTNVALISSDGPYGADVMAAEWTHYMSYSPCLIAVNIRGHDATAHNIEESKEFGVNLASEDQNILGLPALWSTRYKSSMSLVSNYTQV